MSFCDNFLCARSHSLVTGPAWRSVTLRYNFFERLGVQYAITKLLKRCINECPKYLRSCFSACHSLTCALGHVLHFYEATVSFLHQVLKYRAATNYCHTTAPENGYLLGSTMRFRHMAIIPTRKLLATTRETKDQVNQLFGLQTDTRFSNCFDIASIRIQSVNCL